MQRPTHHPCQDFLEQHGYSTAAAGSPGGVSRRAVLIAGAGIFAVAMFGLVLFLPGSGDDGAGPSGNDGPSSALSGSGSSPSGSGSSPSGSPSSGSPTSSGGPAAPAESTACELRREEQIVLDFSSADIQPTIPAQYFQSNAYASGFVTPPFEWSPVPPETTEVAILILRLTDERAADYLNDPELWLHQVPTGQIRWILSGVDPSLTSLPSTSLTSPPPAGSVEQGDHSPVVTVDGEQMSNKFVGPDINGRYFMFAAFALCDRQSAPRDAFMEGGLQRDSIAIGWFIAKGQR